jgi:hypothetical protein
MNHLFGPGESAQVAIDDNAVEAVIYKSEKIAEQLSEPIHGNQSTRTELRRGPEKNQTQNRQNRSGGQGFSPRRRDRLHPSRAAEHNGRLVTVGPLVLFSTETGDAWLLDPADHLAARIARDGDPEELYFEETDSTFAIDWKGNYQIAGDAFVFIDRDTTRVTTILGYPTQRLAQLG